MHDSKFGVGGVFRTFVCFLILLCMLAKVLMIICMSNFLKQFLKNFFLKILEFSKLMGMLFMVVCLDVDCP